jgi:hypothetical protein
MYYDIFFAEIKKKLTKVGGWQLLCDAKVTSREWNLLYHLVKLQHLIEIACKFSCNIGYLYEFFKVDKKMLNVETNSLNFTS